MSDVDTAAEATTVPASVSAEIAVMRRLVNALETLDQPTQRRGSPTATSSAGRRERERGHQ